MPIKNNFLTSMIKKFAREFAIFLLVSGVSRLLPFLLVPLFTHFISPEEMGKLELILAAYSILMVFGVCQIDTALQRFYSKSKHVPKTALVNTIKLSLVISAVVIIASPFISNSTGNVIRVNDIIIASLSIFFANVFVICSLIIRYSRTIIYIIIVNILQTLLFASFAYFFIVQINIGISGYLYAMLISYFIASSMALLFSKDKLSICYSAQDANDIWRFSLPQMPARIASVMTQYGNRFLLLLLFNQSVIGIFSVANKIASLMLVFLSAFSMVWYPILYGEEKNNNFAKIERLYKVVIFFLMLAVLIFIVFTHFVFRFYISESYSSGENIAQILIVATSILVIKEMVDAGIKLTNKVSYISYIYITNAIFYFLLVFILGKYFGLTGVAYAILLANSTLAIATAIISKRNHRLNLEVKYLCFYIFYGMILLWVIDILTQ